MHYSVLQAAAASSASIVGQSLRPMKVLVGDTGLVGSVLRQSTNFDATFNSSNIHELPDIANMPGQVDELYLACLPATKWLVNQDPVKDFNNILSIVDVLTAVWATKVILISTIDIYQHADLGGNEHCWTHFGPLSYGTNRLLFETIVQDTLAFNTCIVRLPAVFHPFIKKNILFDLLNDNNVEQVNGNSAYQWYPLRRLWQDIQLVKGEEVINLFPPPIETLEIIDKFFPNTQIASGDRIFYDYRTMATESSYWLSKDEVMQEMEAFINEARG
jgi:hypothetical protein